MRERERENNHGQKTTGKGQAFHKYAHIIISELSLACLLATMREENGSWGHVKMQKKETGIV